jgi:hypothetical protein
MQDSDSDYSDASTTEDLVVLGEFKVVGLKSFGFNPKTLDKITLFKEGNIVHVYSGDNQIGIVAGKDMHVMIKYYDSINKGIADVDVSCYNDKMLICMVIMPTD